jgi:glutathione S-transferase
MEPILFYGVPEGCSFGSIVALEWAGRPYRLCRIAMPETAASEGYKLVNPVGETPSLMTGTGEVISQSLAILHHLGAGAIDRGLAFAQGTAAFDRLNEKLAFLNTSFFEAFSPLWYALENGAEGTEKDALRAFGRRKVEKAHADLEAMLGDRDWLLGDSRTLADAYFVGIARWNEFHEVLDRRDYPALHRLRQRLEDDPAVRFAHAVEEEQNARSSGAFRGHVSLNEALELLRSPG